jgi:hypothetical protein
MYITIYYRHLENLTQLMMHDVIVGSTVCMCTSK